MATNALLVSNSDSVQRARSLLERAGCYDNSKRITTVSEDPSKLAIPLTQLGVREVSKILQGHQPMGETPISKDLKDIFEFFDGCRCALGHVESLPESKKALGRGRRESVQLLETLRKRLSETRELSENDQSRLIGEVPHSWERHGDLVVLPRGSFANPLWQVVGWKEVWAMVASSLRCKRVAVGGRVACDGYRSSGVHLVLGEDEWVEHIDNGIKYVFYVTRCMFSSGNVSEKIRVAGLKCSGESVVDLYAGIGYFTLPFLVHAGAKMVHACEWNPHAVEALRRGLEANGVADRCTVHFGDNRQVAPVRVADRVNLGLLPSSEAGWPVACAALRPDKGGWLHVHGNVSTKLDSVAPFTEANPWELTETQPESLENSPRALEAEHVNAGSSQTALETSSGKLEGADFSQEKSAGFCQGKSTANLALSDDSIQTTPVSWRWGAYVAGRMCDLLSRENPLPCGQQWEVELRHIERVKSYAPHVDHLVADIECRPTVNTTFQQ